MKKIIFSMIMVSLLLCNSSLFAVTATIQVNKTGGGGTIWNLFAERYDTVKELHVEATNTHTLECEGNGSAVCKWSIDPPKFNLSNYPNLYEDAENYANDQMKLNITFGSHSDILIGTDNNQYVRKVEWNVDDINNIMDYNVMITIIPYDPNYPNF